MKKFIVLKNRQILLIIFINYQAILFSDFWRLIDISIMQKATYSVKEKNL